eukprot:scaffold7576_cov61-Phaeocystis_antarctica.AAC.7
MWGGLWHFQEGTFTCCEAIVNDAAVPGDKGASVAGVSCESCCEGHDASHGQGSEFGQVLVRLRRVGPFLLTSISIASCKSCSMYRCVVMRRRLGGLSVVLSADIVEVSGSQANGLLSGRRIIWWLSKK